MTRFDVLGIGVTAVDDLLYVDRYPPPDAKIAVLRSERQCGGLAATALVAASRLGAKCAYAGVLDDADLSRFVTHRLNAEGIDTSYLVKQDGARPIHSFIVVDVTENTRTIMFDKRHFVGAHPELPEAEQIRASKVLFVDHYGIPGMIRAARIAREAGVAVVSDVESRPEPGTDALLDLVDHVILSQDFALELTGKKDPSDAVRALWTDDRAVVCVTSGAGGCWYTDVSRVGAPKHTPAFPVDVLDTTGCGDVFHGAYAAAYASGLVVEERIRFASAAAALKATQRGGQDGIPDRATVESLLVEQSR